MDSLQTISNDLVESINEKEKKKSIPYDTYAKVIRIDGGTAWVHIPGGVDETPVALTVNAKVGDSVLVRVSGGNAWIVGNKTAPPTDDTKAVEAKGAADVAQVKAAEAQETAENAEATAASAGARASSALEIAEGTNEHFWHDNTGAHITQITQEDWQTTPAGGNTLITSEGMAIRDGMTSLAVFEDDGIRIGQNDQARAEVTPYTFEAVDKEGDTFFSVEDLRDETGGVHTVTDTFISDGTTTNLNLTYRATNTSYTVTVDGGAPPASMTKTQTQIVFGLVPTEGAVIVATYQTASQYAKAYTLGIRAANSVKGGMSTAEGQECIASGRYSHAEGHGSQATGSSAHAEGVSSQATGTGSHAEGSNTQATSNGSHAEGLYTEANGYGAHAEGQHCKAILDSDHAEGSNCIASGGSSHAEGDECVASERWAHAQNEGTIANKWGQTALGTYNEADTAPATAVHPNGYTDFGHYAVIIGNGWEETARSNALTVDWQGNVDMAGVLQSFFNIVDLKVSVGQVAAHAQNNIGTVTVPTADQPDGMTLVGIVGVACNNYRVVPYNYYVNGAHSITCAVVNTTTAQSAAGTTMTFKLLYAKMASA